MVRGAANFDYLLRTPLSQITTDSVEAAKKEAETLRLSKVALENTREVELWKKDLSELRKSIWSDKSYHNIQTTKEKRKGKVGAASTKKTKKKTKAATDAMKKKKNAKK